MWQYIHIGSTDYGCQSVYLRPATCCPRPCFLQPRNHHCSAIARSTYAASRGIVLPSASFIGSLSSMSEQPISWSNSRSCAYTLLVYCSITTPDLASTRNGHGDRVPLLSGAGRTSFARVSATATAACRSEVSPVMLARMLNPNAASAALSGSMCPRPSPEHPR